MAATTYKQRWTLDDRAESVWHSLPVDVPPDCPGLLVTLTVPPVPGAVIDLGCEGAAGWRGWSGGARQTFAITPTAATPGYLPGDLEPGTWWIVIGLHRLPVEGVDLTVEAVTGPVGVVPGLDEYAAATDAVAVPQRPPRRILPAADGLRWVAGDFHAHSLHSDGSTPIAHLAALGVTAGLDVLACTDHNTEAHHRELPALGHRFGIGLIPGQEITTDTGHANAFGAIGTIDFRRPAAHWVTDVAARGGLLSINHPLGGDCAWRHPLPAPTQPARVPTHAVASASVDSSHPGTAPLPAAQPVTSATGANGHPPLAEIWHSSWLDRRWGGPISWWQAWGLGTTPIGGSDWHNPNSLTPPGSPTTWIAVDESAATPDELVTAVLEGLAAGRTAISAGYTAPVLLRNGDEFVVLDAPNTLLISPDGTRRAIRTSHETLPAEQPGGHVLVTHTGEFVAISH